MSGLSAILTFQTPLPQGQLEDMLAWTRPTFAAADGKTAKTHTYKNASIGTFCQEHLASDAAGMVWIAFCGQLFDKIATEQNILSRYLETGSSCFSELDGEYSFIILDTRSQELFAVRDRLGVYPLYWHVNTKSAYISTSIKAILSTGAISPTPDLAGIAQSLALGFISQDVTCIEGINRLLPGYYLKLNLAGSFSITPYWSYSSTFEQEYSRGFDSSIDIYCDLERQINASIARRAPGKNAACLSGNIGSYIIWDALQGKSNISLLEIEPTADDFLASIVQMVWAMEMPNAQVGALTSWKYINACKEQNLTCFFDTGFSAEFYDYSKEAQELFQSHYLVPRNFEPSFWSKLGFRLNPKKSLSTLRRMQEATPQIAFVENKLLISPDEFADAAPELGRYFDVSLFINQFYNLKRIRKLDASLFYLTLKSTVTDSLSESRLRFAHACGVQAQSPFLDYRLLEFFSSLPPEIWASPDLLSAFPKYWLQNKEITGDVAAWPKASPKPDAIFLSKDVWPWFCGLEKSRLVETGLVHPKWIKKALQNPKEHLLDLYTLLILEVWIALFIDLPLQESNKDLRVEDLLVRG